MKKTLTTRHIIAMIIAILIIIKFNVNIEVSASSISNETSTTKYNFYFGQLHAHTDFSDGIGTPDEAYAKARFEGGADFFAVTDHSNYFDNEKTNENTVKIADSTSNTWKNLHAAADRANVDGSFVAIAGYEMTWSEQSGWGHINTFNTPWFVSKNNRSMNLQTYYKKLAESTNNSAINQFNHPGIFGDFADYGFYDKEVDKVIQLIEVGNGEAPFSSSSYHRFYGMYTRALDKGWHLAPTNNQDNHKGNFIIANEARTVVLAKELTRSGVFEAIQNMRVYATEDRNMEITYEINGLPMGTTLDNPSILNVYIKVNDPDITDDIQSISLISDNGITSAYTEVSGNQKVWNLTLAPNYSYYYVKVISEDGDVAVTAPIWTGKGIVPVVTNNDLIGHWAKPSIESLIEDGMLSGYADGTFKPDAYITRGELIKTLVKALEIKTVNAEIPIDTQNHWASYYIATALGSNIVSGYPDGTFKPFDYVTRQEVAVIVYNAKKLSASNQQSEFVDSELIASWAKKAIDATVAAGYITGYQDSTIRPKGLMTKAEAATLIHRMRD